MEPLSTRRDSLGEVGEVLDDLGDERERPGRPVVWIFLHQVEERRRHDGGAEEAQEQRGADQALADVLLVAASDALLLPRRKHFLQLPRKHTEETGRRQEGDRKDVSNHCRKEGSSFCSFTTHLTRKPFNTSGRKYVLMKII